MQAAESIAAAAPDVLKVQVLDVAKCTELGMGCYLAVGAASANTPRFIHLTYSTGGRNPLLLAYRKTTQSVVICLADSFLSWLWNRLAFSVKDIRGVSAVPRTR